MSKYLDALEAQLATEADEYVRAELLARKAAYLARVGRFNDARDIIGNIRAAFGDGRSGRVTILLMIAEGLVARFESLGTQANDRINRAQLLAQAGRDPELIALTSAWKGYLEFERSDFEPSARSLRLALSTGGPTDHAAQARVSSVLVMAFSIAGDDAAVKKHFALGREHALAAGDQATVDALLHNKAIFGAAYLRASNCVEAVSHANIEHSIAEIKSARNLQQLAGVSAFGFFADLAEARLLIVDNRFTKALERIDSVRGCSPLPRAHVTEASALLERVYCLAKVGRVQEAIEDFAVLRGERFDGIDPDDRMVAHWQLRELTIADAAFGDRDEAASLLSESTAAYLNFVDRLRAAYADWA
jgi:tetratricopeptide (TPR) repeat protein